MYLAYSYMKSSKTTRLLAAAAALTVGASAFGEGLLGKRYIEAGIATDFDFDGAAYGIAFNTNIHDGIDFNISGSISDDSDVRLAVASVNFFKDLNGDGSLFGYFAPAIGVLDYDFGPFDDSDFVWGGQLGVEIPYGEKTNFDISATYLDASDFDLGWDLGVEVNHWVTDTFNVGVGISYNTEAEDETLSFSGRFAF